MNKIEVVYKNIDELIPYINNSRTHSDAQVAQIAASIKEFGWTNPVLMDGDNGIIAGHGRILAARVLGHTDIPTIELSHMTDIKKRAYIISDNKLALNAGWDEELLGLEITELQEFGFNIDLLGFDANELKELIGEKKENIYSQSVDVPTYQPSGEKPLLEDLYNDEKAMDLITSIKESNINEKEKEFLMTAASRHIVFNYEKIANFYAHSSKECQELMECNALVIIDFNKAIENGFVKLTEEINEMFDVVDDE
jgi:hypothetical protein